MDRNPRVSVLFPTRQGLQQRQAVEEEQKKRQLSDEEQFTLYDEEQIVAIERFDAIVAVLKLALKVSLPNEHFSGLINYIANLIPRGAGGVPGIQPIPILALEEQDILYDEEQIDAIDQFDAIVAVLKFALKVSLPDEHFSGLIGYIANLVPRGAGDAPAVPPIQTQDLAEQAVIEVAFQNVSIQSAPVQGVSPESTGSHAGSGSGNEGTTSGRSTKAQQPRCTCSRGKCVRTCACRIGKQHCSDACGCEVGRCENREL